MLSSLKQDAHLHDSVLMSAVTAPGQQNCSVLANERTSRIAVYGTGMKLSTW